MLIAAIFIGQLNNLDRRNIEPSSGGGGGGRDVIWERTPKRNACSLFII